MEKNGCPIFKHAFVTRKTGFPISKTYFGPPPKCLSDFRNLLWTTSKVPFRFSKPTLDHLQSAFPISKPTSDHLRSAFPISKTYFGPPPKCLSDFKTYFGPPPKCLSDFKTYFGPPPKCLSNFKTYFGDGLKSQEAMHILAGQVSIQ